MLTPVYRLLVLFLFFFLPGALGAAEPAGLGEAAIRAHIKFLADDLLEGRGTGSRGGEIAAHYIAASLEAMGLQGAAAKGSFFQLVSLVGVKADPKTALSVSGHGKKETFHFGDEFVAFTGSQSADVNVDAELIFVGYGIESKREHWNDYKGNPEDFKGKVLVMLVNDPPATSAEPNLFGGRALTYEGRWTYKYEEAARRGAAGAILLHTDSSAGYPWSVVRTSNGSWHFDIARENEGSPFLPMRAWMTDASARRLMAMAGTNLDELRRLAASREFRPISLGLNAEVHLQSEVKKVEAPNVAGILRGRDPKLKREFVVLSAHWDHLGIGEPDKKGDRIYNGALDNASGVAGVLDIASALSRRKGAERPKRSVLFFFPTAEEQGLLGSEWYVHHPLVPLSQTVADLNLDGLNVLGRTEDLIALGAERSTLLTWAEKVAKADNVRLSPEARPEQGSYFRSDHFPFAQAGVPAISLDNGDAFVGRPKGWGEEQFRAFNEAHYHQPSDEYRASWDLKGALQEEAFLLELAMRLADSPERPRNLGR